MLTNPFPIFDQFSGRLVTCIFTKDDDVQSDQQALDLIGNDKLPMASLWQIHGNKTVIVSEPTERTIQADGLITNKPNLILSVRFADCQNILVYDPNKKILGLLHVGWRGLIAYAIAEFFKKLKQEFNSDSGDVFVAAGPSLCQKCSRFSDPAKELPDIDPSFFDDHFVDLRGIAEKQLWEAGIKSDHFERHPDCTCCNPEVYWTYRGEHREKVKNGKSNMLACSII